MGGEMETKGLEWLRTADARIRCWASVTLTIATLVGVLTGWFQKALEVIHLPQAAPLLGVVIIGAATLYLWRDYRRFFRQSRIEQPDKFTLLATTPESLIGRDRDLNLLFQTVMQKRIVLLDGESGCGKSALVGAGLVPRLQNTDRLLPGLVRDWGDDWVHGPLSAMVEALYGALTAEQRERVEWEPAPDLAAPAEVLTAELSKFLNRINNVLQWRPLLIADQFDDYQSQHHERFVDPDGNWVTPTMLAESNPFWALVSRLLQHGKLHLLVVSRSDAASGWSCIRFIDDCLIATRTVRRVDFEFIRPLLFGIAPDDASPPVVSNPGNGWFALRDLLEADLRKEGAVLMQQVRTVLLGLRQLPVLTPKAYRREHGMSGVETLVITRALRSSSATLGGGEAGMQVARAMLNSMVLPTGSDQQPKVHRQPLSELAKIAGDRDRAQNALHILQEEEIVRPTGGYGAERAWQLDHDYIARSVIAESRQANRWGMALRESYLLFQRTGDSWRHRWATLLPVALQARLLWEVVRGRLRYGETATYALLSTIKPAIMLAMCFGAVWGAVSWHETELAQDRAQALAFQLGAGNPRAVLDAWEAPDQVQTALFELMAADPSLLYSACKTGWPAAYVGVDPARALVIARLIRSSLEQTQNQAVASVLASSYTTVVNRLRNQDDIKTEVSALHARLDGRQNTYLAAALVQAYAAVAQRLQSQKDIASAAQAIRIRLDHTESSRLAQALASAYRAIAQKLKGQDVISAEAAALLGHLERPQNQNTAGAVASAYGVVAHKLRNQKVISTDAAALLGQLEQVQSPEVADAFAVAYAAIAQKLQNQKIIAIELTSLSTQLERDDVPDVSKVFANVAIAFQNSDAPTFDKAIEPLERREALGAAFARSYAAVARRLQDQNAIASAAAVLRRQLPFALLVGSADDYVRSYVSVAQKLQDQTAIATELAALQSQVEHAPPIAALLESDDDLPWAYGAIAQKLENQQAIARAASWLRHESEHTHNLDIAAAFVPPFADVAQNLQSQEDISNAAAWLHGELRRMRGFGTTPAFASAYATVAQRLRKQQAIASAAAWLRGDYVSAHDPDLKRAFAEAYADIAQELQGRQAVGAAAWLRDELRSARRPDVVAAFARAYAILEQEFRNSQSTANAATWLGDELQNAQSPELAGAFAKAYAIVEGSVIRVHQGEVGWGRKNSRRILTLAGQPFLRDPTPLLTLLKPIADRRFGGDVAAAVAWWVSKYQIGAVSLRPQKPPESQTF